MTKIDTVLDQLNNDLRPFIEKDVRDPVKADHLRQKILNMVRMAFESQAKITRN